MTCMYSAEWFEMFSATVPSAFVEADLRGIAGVLPADTHRRILDVGCGIGRIAGPLAARGYAVTGLDVNLEALRTAQRRAPGPRYVALDQCHSGRMRWVFDGALVLWNSLGFAGRRSDRDTLAGLAQVVRPGGKVVLDLYHPDWLRRNEKSGERDPRGPVVSRWLRDGRCCHEIRYPNGRVDDIQFNVYQPAEIRALARRAGLQPQVDMVWWNPDSRPSPDAPRYQLVCTRP